LSNTKSLHTMFTHVVLLSVTFFWSFNNIVFKIAFASISAPMFNLLRLLIAFPFMIYIAFFLPRHVPFNKRDLFFLTLLGIGGFGVFQLLFPIGIDLTSPSIGGILMATMPIHVVVLSTMFKLEKITPAIIIGIIFTIIGLSLITFFSRVPNQQFETSFTGIILVVVAELGFAINTTFIKGYLKTYPPLQLTGFVMAVSVIVFCSVNVKTIIEVTHTPISFKIFLLASYSGLIALLGSNVLWNRAVGYLGSAKTSVYANVPPVFVLFLSMIFFKDFPHPIALLGSAIILMGVYVVQFSDKKKVSRLRQP